MTHQRDFYAEAITIATGEAFFVVQKEHVVALWEVIRAMTLRQGELANQRDELLAALRREAGHVIDHSQHE